jgi:MFS family permease
MLTTGRNSEIPSNLVLKKISPKIWLPFLTAAWGIIAMCLGFVKNYASFMVVRAFLGIAEGGLLPGIVRSLCLRSETVLMRRLIGVIPVRHVHTT